MPAPDSSSDLLGLLAVALVLGIRHGFDADHLAAIDAMARFNVVERPQLARRTGFWFSLGHGVVVIAVALLVATLAHGWQAPAWLEPFGAWTSIAVLLLLGVVNLMAGWRAADQVIVALVGWRTGWFSRFLRAGGPLPIAGVGALFALSFDTLSQAALMAVTGTAVQGIAAAASLAAAFMLGMLVTDGINGLWVARLLQRSDATAARASRVMCLGIASVSLGTAALGAAARLSSSFADWARVHEGSFGFAVVGVVLGSFALGAAFAWRARPTGAQGRLEARVCRPTPGQPT